MTQSNKQVTIILVSHYLITLPNICLLYVSRAT